MFAGKETTKLIKHPCFPAVAQCKVVLLPPRS
jgi:hypothetical protein